MCRSRTIPIATVLSTMFALGAISILSSSSHEQDEAPSPGTKGTVGPNRGATVAMPAKAIGLEITLGLKDDRRTDWSGTVSVSEGRVLELDIVRSTLDATVQGNRFNVATKNVAAKKKKKAATAIPAVLRASLDTPESATVTIRTAHGSIAFKPSELAPGERRTFLDGEAAIERQEAAIRLTGRGAEEDFPAAAKAPDGSVWLTYVEYQPEAPRLNATVGKKKFETLVPSKNGDRIVLRRFQGSAWQPPIDVTPPGLDVWRPTVAVAGDGNVFVAWAQQVEGNWDIYTRRFTPPEKPGGEGAWTKTLRLTEDKGSDFHVVSTTDSKGSVWLAWQAFRNGNYDILTMALDKDGNHPAPGQVSVSKANDWGPAIASDATGGVFIAWDTYDKGNYDVLLRDVGRDAPPVVVAESSRFEGRPSVACDAKGRVWVAYEQGDEQWGKDYAHAGNVQNVGQEKNPGFALYVNRTIALKCVNGKTVSRLDDASALKFGNSLGNRNKSVPRLAFDGGGNLWLLFRHHPLPGGAGEVWVGSALAFDGKTWSAPRRLASSMNLIDNRPALVGLESGLLAVYSGDYRQNAQTRVEDDLFAAVLASSAAAVEPALVADSAPAAATLATVHPNEPEDVARMRGYRIENLGKMLRPLRGEFHRHTEISSHNDQDGLLEDSWRYALDAASHDWMGNGDHDNGFGFEYLWWIIQKTADLHHNPPYFVGAQTYERSVVFPNGHRNVMMPRRGIRPLPRGNLEGTYEAGTPDTKLLYAYLKHFDGICASHTPTTNMGTDWRDNDPDVEPVVEIYQGHRHNSEHPGAPRAPTEATNIGGWQPKGFIWNALEKGYKLGFQSSSDHVSTHWSYAIVYAEDTSRPAIIDAFKKRHCYAATDNILLDVRSGDRMMGDTFTSAGKPRLSITVKGTAPVARVHVIRDNKYVLSTEPKARDVALTYSDDDAKVGTAHYYYVRVEQADGNLAWSSPMWITTGN